MATRLPERTEVLVIGGGPAGAVAALALARLGVPVVVMDSGTPRWPVGETLPPGARPLLERIGLHPALATEGHLASVGTWAVWGDPEPRGRDHVFGRFGHGWHLDRRRFDALLRESARAAGAQLVFGATVTGSESLTGGGYRVRFGGGQIAARLVLDASGRGAAFARQRGVRRRILDRMVAVVAYVERHADGDAGPVATLVEAMPDGWWYSAPLPQNRLVATFLTDADLVDASTPTTQGWLARLAAAPYTGARAARYGSGLVAPPALVPAASGVLERLADGDWLAVGDAAATQDPLSSEGILRAIESGIDAALAAMRALDGDAHALPAAAAARAERWRGYLDARVANYAVEQRWPVAPFWRRRHQDARPEVQRSVA